MGVLEQKIASSRKTRIWAVRLAIFIRAVIILMVLDNVGGMKRN